MRSACCCCSCRRRWCSACSRRARAVRKVAPAVQTRTSSGESCVTVSISPPEVERNTRVTGRPSFSQQHRLNSANDKLEEYMRTRGAEKAVPAGGGMDGPEEAAPAAPVVFTAVPIVVLMLGSPPLELLSLLSLVPPPPPPPPPLPSKRMSTRHSFLLVCVRPSAPNFLFE